ncbi:hypothetical protein HG535_0B02050 [Zygotorulaspora mrakii]|uniref:Tafazzin family protein n=1 Tax=Zygotorulaspora mrakii TaxID=42260 RepID=A0A7H9AYC7_ZYGMR|nr:uncharacterized protein HG535_0B02050 [Zygotorulaspora mrakii]QLG71167.1 hypothetical protein HG535_0B02050 [Zygotorulaspora mrakii]
MAWVYCATKKKRLHHHQHSINQYTLCQTFIVFIMSLPNVLARGDEFLGEYPRNSTLWRFFSYGTCVFTIGMSKLILKSLYNVKLDHMDRLDNAINRSQSENRGLLTIMNHMSVIDDPFIWGIFPWRIYKDLDSVRWCLGANNVCFQNKILATFFSLGQVLSTERFGVGPFQGSIDAAIRLLSPDDTLDLEWTPYSETPNKLVLPQKAGSLVKTIKEDYLPPIKRYKPSWMHVYPEGFVLQLHPPFSNSMRYFKWGVSRMILESTVAPIIVPIFTTGFEKIASEEAAGSTIKRYIPTNFGAEIKVTVGNTIEDNVIEKYREEWRQLVDKYYDPKNPVDLTQELKYGKEAQDLRSRLAAELRKYIAQIRHDECKFPEEDARFQSSAWWKSYTLTEGASDPDVKFIGKNWAIRRLQKFLTKQEENDRSSR